MARREPLVDVHSVRSVLRGLWARSRPDAEPLPGTPAPTERERWLRQLDATRNALERARSSLEQGWTSGAWFTVGDAAGATRQLSPFEALAFRDARRPVVGSCLVGALVRLAQNPDDPTTSADLGRCVNELYEAMHEQLGHVSSPPGRARPPEERREHVRRLTAWNDAPGRTRAEVLDLVDRAVARTIVAACS